MLLGPSLQTPLLGAPTPAHHEPRENDSCDAGRSHPKPPKETSGEEQSDLRILDKSHLPSDFEDSGVL